MSVRLQLTIYWAGVLSLLLVGAAVAVFLLFQRLQWGRLDGALIEEADTAAEMIARGANAAQMVARLSEERDLGPNRRVRVVVGTRIIADAGEPDADPPNFRQSRLGRMVVDGQDHLFRYAIAWFSSNGARAYLVDGVDARNLRESVERLRTSLLFVIPILLIGSIYAGYWLAGRTLEPLATVASELAEIRPRDLSRRLPLSPVEDEVGRLISAINALLERVERSSSAERRFAADAAHELRTPLAVLRTGIEVALRHDRSTAEYKQALNNALRDAAAVCEMADDLLALTRLDQELSSGREPIELRGLTEEVLDSIEPLTASKRLIIATDLRTRANVLGNRDHLRRLLINLVDNAVKFTPEGGKIVLALDSHNGVMKLRIADSGPGINQEDLPFIFERFYRGRDGRSEPGKGLGLSLCREIVEAHGGEIRVSNRPAGGAEFIVTLPAEQA
ncbi:MAG: HAMP domain-containing protein [Deltaproteobacteria bacterium]|nr:HAMP domain-containing protein [Deltaproteobacteria bacterium]